MKPRRAALLVLFAGSGAAALVYQVAWMRELGLLFGNTTHAAASTLAIFFLGLAVGGAWFGRRAPALHRPLRTFAWLELGVAVTAAVPLLVLLPLYRAIFAPLYASVGSSAFLFTSAKLGLAALILLPSAVLMGGTLPVLGQALLVDRRRLGRGGGWLYAVNTVGAAGGAFAAAFLLPERLGYRGTYVVALAASATIGALALILSRGAAHTPAPVRAVAPTPLASGLVALAFLSGAFALGLEVLWTRAFAQVLQNSVYTFGAILVVFLLALGAGAGIAALLARSLVPPRSVLSAVLVTSGVLVALGPRVFAWVNRDMQALEGHDDFGGYLVAVFRHLFLVLFVPVAALGVVLPFLLRAAGETDESSEDAGGVLGRIVAWNTVGALLGALVAGFLLVSWFGPWVSIILIGGGYLLAGALVLRPVKPIVGAALMCLLVPLGFEAHAQHAAARERMVPYRMQGPGGRRRASERVLAVYEGAAGTVTVTEGVGTRTRRLRFNRYYTLGSSGEPEWERLQAHLPVLLHPDPKSVFFLGMGTGVTAGGALVHDVDRVVVTELIPEVVRAARDHFGRWTNGLFTDARAEILAVDARTVLRGTDDRYDVIVGDLFLPWKRGVGSLFTREQLEAGRDRLTERGLYAQWLPMYQLGDAAFASIARTFHDVFARVTVWRCEFFAERPIVALIGHATREPLDAEAFQARFEALADRGLLGFEDGASSMPFQLYAGSLDTNVHVLPVVPINTDDRPWLELTAPRRQVERRVGGAEALVGARLLEFFEQLQHGLPPARDPYLVEASPTQRGWVEAGRYLYAYSVADDQGDRRARREALEAWSARVAPADRPDIDRWVR